MDRSVRVQNMDIPVHTVPLLHFMPVLYAD